MGVPQDGGLGWTLRIVVCVVQMEPTGQWDRTDTKDSGTCVVQILWTSICTTDAHTSRYPKCPSHPTVLWTPICTMVPHTHTAILIVCPDSMIMSAVVIASLCSDYSAYFDAIPIQAMVYLSLFWSGTLSLVEIVSMMNAMGVNVVSSANVPSSEIINNIPPVGNRLSWCGNESGEYYTLFVMHA